MQCSCGWIVTGTMLIQWKGKMSFTVWWAGSKERDKPLKTGQLQATKSTEIEVGGVGGSVLQMPTLFLIFPKVSAHSHHLNNILA